MSLYHNHNRRAGPALAPVVKQETVTVVQFGRGQGCCELSLVRIVTAYYSADGELLFEFDPAPEAVTADVKEPI